MNDVSSANLTIIRLALVMALTGLSKSSIYAFGHPASPQFDPTFPRRVKIGSAAVGWIQGEILGWIRQRVAFSRPEGLSSTAN